MEPLATGVDVHSCSATGAALDAANPVMVACHAAFSSLDNPFRDRSGYSIIFEKINMPSMAFTALIRTWRLIVLTIYFTTTVLIKKKLVPEAELS